MGGSEGRRGGVGTRIAISALAAVLVATVAVAALVLRGHSLPISDASGLPGPGEDGRYPADRLTLAELGGAKENHASVDSLAGVRALNVLTDSELAVYAAAGVTRVKVGVSDYGDVKATVILAHLSDRRVAGDSARELAELQLSFGFHAMPGAPSGVAAALLPGSPLATPPVAAGGRAHYVRGDVLARMEVRGPDEGITYARFGTLLGAQLEALPADD